MRTLYNVPSRCVPENDRPPGASLADRPGQRTLRLHEAVVAVAELEARAVRAARLARRDQDRAGGRVLPEQGALRSAQDLDAIDVDEIERRRGRPSVEHAVDVKTDAGLDAVVRQAERRAEPANVHTGIARIRGVQLESRDQLLHAIGVERAGVFERVTTDDGERDRHVLRELFLAASRDRHLFDTRIACRGDLLRRNRRARAKSNCSRADNDRDRGNSRRTSS